MASDLPKPCTGGVSFRTPAIIAGAIGLAKAAIGMDPAPADVRRQRRALCLTCEHRKGRRCGVCRCLIVAKVRLAGSVCPLPDPKWGPVLPDNP
jgi:hypothetical protein